MEVSPNFAVSANGGHQQAVQAPEPTSRSTIGIQSPLIQNIHNQPQNPMEMVMSCDRASQWADSTREYISNNGIITIKQASKTATATRKANCRAPPCSQSLTSHKINSASTPVALRAVEKASADNRRRKRPSDRCWRFPAPHNRGKRR